MRIIHTADWHLGRLFHGVNLLEDQVYVLDNFMHFVKDSKPDVILIAGDVYDRFLPPADAVTLLGEILTRISLDEKIPVLIIAGNHDNPERLSFAQGILGHQGVHIVGVLNDFFRPVVIYDSSGPVYFCPIPYAEPAYARSFLQDENIRDHHDTMVSLTQNMLKGIPPKARKVALAHALVMGGEECESERPLTVVGGASAVNPDAFRDFHYVALGHLHRAQRMGCATIRYAGSLMKYSFSEADHQKSVTLLELDEQGGVSYLEETNLGCRRDLRVVEGNLKELLQGPPEGVNKEDYLKVILKDEGALLDPLGKLRTVYPHVLELERPMFSTGAGKGKPAMDHRKMSEADLFSAFFTEVWGQAMSPEEEKELLSMLHDFEHQERGL